MQSSARDELFNLLEGEFKGKGLGSYPAIKDFEYTEHVSIHRLGQKPVFSYTQKTKSSEGNPLHAESGYFRLLPNKNVEWIIAQPTGVTEIQVADEIELKDGKVFLSFASTGLQRSPSAKDPQTIKVARKVTLSKEGFEYKLEMATSTTKELTHHLKASLKRE